MIENENNKSQQVENENGKETIDTVSQEEMNKPHSKHEAPMPEREGASKELKEIL